MSKCVLTLGLTLATLLTPSVIAATKPNNDDAVALSRYVEVTTDVNRQQRNPLQTVVSISYPPNIKRVGQAINYTIQSTGYSMNDLDMTVEETRILYTLSLPEVHKSFEHVKVINILKTLAGDAFVPMADPVRRKVDFKPVIKLNSLTR